MALSLRELRRLLVERLSLSEVRTICFDLSIKYEDLSGDTLSDKVLGLLDLCMRTGRMEELVDTIVENRVDLKPLIQPNTPPPVAPERPPTTPEPQPSAKTLYPEVGEIVTGKLIGEHKSRHSTTSGAMRIVVVDLGKGILADVEINALEMFRLLGRNMRVKILSNTPGVDGHIVARYIRSRKTS